MSQLKQTPSQTVGPFFAYGLTPTQYGYDLKSLFTPVLARPHAQGEHLRITGQVFDGAGNAVVDAMVEIAQPDGSGQPITSVADAEARGFTGFGRCGTGTDPERRFVFDTIKPGAPGPGQAPHLSVIVFMRGMLVHVHTRIYFPDEPANAGDPVLLAVPEARRGTLIAQADGPGRYRFDIRMQGDGETVFFEI